MDAGTSRVMAGLVPATQTLMVPLPETGHRDKPGDDSRQAAQR